jgi:pimeloyl-ACP methyl ester carboxylesterase
VTGRIARIWPANESFGRGERLLCDSQHEEATMTSGATYDAVHQTVAPAQIKVAGMAGDLYGGPDGRPPLVLLSGLTYARGTWQPVLGELGRIDPGRQVLVLDLPGHGDSPDQFPHTLERIVRLVRDAVGEAGLGTPVLAGHSQAGGIASIYAAQYPTSGVVNVDAPPNLGAVIQVLRAAADQNQGDLLGTWATMKRGFRIDLLPPEARELLARNTRPRTELLASYWEELFAMTPDQASAMVGGALAALAAAEVPYLLILGTEPPPEIAAWLRNALPQAVVEVWAGSGHFPHLAHPARFAERLAAMA